MSSFPCGTMAAVSSVHVGERAHVEDGIRWQLLAVADPYLLAGNGPELPIGPRRRDWSHVPVGPLRAEMDLEPFATLPAVRQVLGSGDRRIAA